MFVITIVCLLFTIIMTSTGVREKCKMVNIISMASYSTLVRVIREAGELGKEYISMGM